jgi:hypothetical protein
MRRIGIRLFLFTLVIASSSPQVVPAQSISSEPAANASAPPPSATRPGRDPNQPIDEEYTKKIHEYTTEPFFLSPLVDYLPASSTVPTPKAVLGDIAGARNNLPYSKEVYAYMRMLAKASPRPRVILRFSEQRDLLASGLLDGNDVAQRPVVVDAPLGKGHVVLFANNPIYRGETIGSYFMVFNTILNFDHLDTGRKLDVR